MATLITRTWYSRGPTGHRVKRIAHGYTLQVNGKQERKFDAARTKDDAGKALAARQLEREQETAPPAPMTLGEAIDRYERVKAGKRSLAEDQRHMAMVKAFFGADTPLSELKAGRIAEYREHLLGRKSTRGGTSAPATCNRALAALRHLLRLAHLEWEALEHMPRIRLEREPEGRLRFLSEPEATRLLAACEESKNGVLTAVVTVALHTGMRRGEILGLTWERVDFSRGVLILEQTKSGKRREVPMNRAVYDALTALPEPHEAGLVFTKRDGRAWGQVRTAFELACQRGKVFDFRFHDLRHTCASWLIMRGRSLKEVQELLGHRDFKMTLRYAHLSPDRLREAVASLETFSTQSTQSAVDSPPASRKPARARSSVG